MALAAIGVNETLVNMLFSQQCQEKQSLSELLEAFAVSNAQAEFRRALKELIRDHLNNCMSLTRNSSSESGGMAGPRTASNCNNFGVPRQRLNHVSERCNICRLRELLHQDDEEEGEQLIRRSTNNDESAETSAARRRQSRILNRWAARQAQEMITTMERQAREAELLSLAGLHSVSTRDSSFLRDPSPNSRPPSAAAVRSVERPSTRASSLVQMWRELEGESRVVSSGRDGRRARNNSSSASQRSRGGSVGSDNRSIHHANDISSAREDPSRADAGHEIVGSNQQPHAEVIEAERENENENENENESEQADNESIDESSRSENPRETEEVHMNSQSNPVSHRIEQSPRLGGERERVRHIVQRWMSESRMIEAAGDGSQGHQQGQGGFAQTGTPSRTVEGQGSSQHERRASLDGSRQSSFVNRNPPRLRGRQALLDLLMRIARERQRELERLLEYRLVSHFSHRNRIQALLRGRFLRSRAIIEEHRSTSTAAAGELGQLRQRRTVSGLREGFPFNAETATNPQLASISEASENHISDSDSVENASSVDYREAEPQAETLENGPQRNAASHGEEIRDSAVSNANDAADDNADSQEVSAADQVEREWQSQEEEGLQPVAQESNIAGSIEQSWQENNLEVNFTIWQGNGEGTVEVDWHNFLDGVDMQWEASGSDVDREWEQAASQGGAEWPENSQLEDMHWQENPDEQDLDGEWHDRSEEEEEEEEESSAWQRLRPTRRVSDFPSLEEATSYNVELRELLSRRSVSTVLASDFRERMDRLILSYIRNRGRPPLTWESEEQDEEEPNDEPLTIVSGPRFGIPPPPPPPPPAQFWRREMQRPLRAHQLQHSELDWEVINELRSDIARLQQGMSELQRMLETCMEMQLELQRSVRQEVSAALNRSAGGQGVLDDTLDDGSKWVTVRKGICCICCDKHIDSLLYRCGHMCTCLKCANELIHNSGKCPMCRAPIVEVVRAYCQV